MELWLIGMQLTCLGCLSSAIGLVLIKHSTSVESNLPLHRRRYWLFGILFLIINASVIDVFAFALAPITLIAPFTGVTIVFTSWLASSGVLFVKETLDVWDATSTGITLAGVTITSIYGPHDSDVPDATTAYRYFAQPDFLACYGFLLTIGGVGWAFFGLNAVSFLRGSRDPKPASGREAAGRILLYAYTAALAGSMSMLLLKVVGSAIRAHLEDVPAQDGTRVPLVTAQLAGCFFALVCCALVQLGFLHRTLANSPVTYGVPTYQTLLTLLTILLGGIFFSEFKRMGVFSMLVFASGVALALFGITLHTTHRAQTSGHEPVPNAPPPATPNAAEGGATSQQRRCCASAAEQGALHTPDSGAAPRKLAETTRLLGS